MALPAKQVREQTNAAKSKLIAAAMKRIDGVFCNDVGVKVSRAEYEHDFHIYPHDSERWEITTAAFSLFLADLKKAGYKVTAAKVHEGVEEDDFYIYSKVSW